jgi:dihydrodipicolinate synthase/N-acetylneuraminate lyase
MDSQAITSQRLRSSVIAVPPLARDQKRDICTTENRRIIEYLERGGISILLYGGNANLYHVRPSEYGRILTMLVELAAPTTLMIPSVGPSFGLMLDQADVLKDYDFPTAMILPQREIVDSAGIATGIESFTRKLGRPAVLYLKHGGLMQVSDVRRLLDDGCLSFVKYAVVREDPANDPYLAEILNVVPAERIVSGMGEQPAIVHMRQFRLAGFTSGCVCIAPKMSQSMLQAILNNQFDAAENLRKQFKGLEDVRNAISPIRVLHQAVAAAGIAETGPHLPMLSELDPFTTSTVQHEARQLVECERNWRPV